MRVARLLAGLSVAISVVGTAAGVPAVAAQATAQAHTSAPQAPAPITRVHASSAGSHGIALRWTNPPATHFAHTVIRVSTGSTAPLTPSGGHRAAVVAKPEHAVVIGHLEPATHYRFALFATDGHGHYARRAVIAAVTAPGKVTNLSSYADGSAIALTWAAPATAYVDVIVRYAKGSVAPKHPWLGHAVALTGKKATRATLSHLAANTAYTARVWTRDRSKRASTPATISFTTAAKPAADGVVTGTVTDTAGHPLAHAVVVLVPNSFTYAVFQATTTSTGAFSRKVPAGDYYVWTFGDAATGGSSDATGYLPHFSSKVIGSGKHVSIGSVRLAAGGAFTGRVTDADGQPLAGVDVTLNSTPEYVWPSEGSAGIGSSVAEVITGADGVFTLKGVSRDAVLVCFDGSSAHTAASASTTTYLAQCSDQPMSVAPRTTRRLPDTHLGSMTVKSSTVVTGHISGPGGRAVADADITFTRSGHEWEDGDTFTANDGSYSMIGLAPGSYKACVDTSTVVDKSATGVAGRCSATAVTVTAGGVTTLDLALSPGAAISGTVTDHHGHRLGDVEVYLKLPDATEGVSVTDGQGHYVAKNLTAGKFRLCLDPTLATVGGRRAYAAPGCVNGGAAIAATAGKMRTGADKRLPAGGALRGRVTDGNGHAVADVAIHVTSANGSDLPDEQIYQLTDRDGRYAVTGLAAGKYGLCVEAYGIDSGNFLQGGPGQVDRCATRSASVTIDHATTVDIDLPVSAGIEVKVHDADGHPVAGVNAVALRKCTQNDGNCSHEPLFDKGKATYVAGTFSSDGSGTADLYGLAPGTYAVCLFAYYGATTTDTPATGYADRCSGDTYSITVGKGQTAHTSLTLSVGGAVSGTVTDTAGHPVAGAAVRVAGSAVSDYDNGYPDFEEGPQQHAMTAADGSYTVRSVRPGDRTVCIDASDATGPNRGGYLDQCLGSTAGSTSKPTSVTVTAGSTTAVAAVQLTPGASISGHVMLGDKVGRSVQYIVMYSDGTWVDDGDDGSDTETNGAGNFRETRLRPDTYVVCFYKYQYKSQCFKDVAWDDSSRVPANATRITLVAGQSYTGVDATLRK